VRGLSLRPHAKINLGLRVLGLRPDGYHELRTRFQTIGLTDELHLQTAPSGLQLRVEGATLPIDSSNLVVRAAEILREGREKLPGAELFLRKRIPLAAGLGGGSSDAAAALLGLNLLWDLRLGTEELKRVGSRVGADVPFFLVGGSALGLGRGDEIVPLHDSHPFHLAVVLPPLTCSTREIFQLWDERHLPSLAAPETRFSGDSDGDPVEEPSGRSVRNDLQDLVVDRHPELARYLDWLLRHGAAAAALSGSGPSLYGLFGSRAEALRALSGPEWSGVNVIECAPRGRAEYWRGLGLPLSD